MKTEKQKMQDGSLYNADDEELIQERLKAKEVLYKYNQTAPSDRKGQERIISGLLGGHGDNLRIVAPFYCDYGYNIHVGNNFFANFGCTILDGAEVHIGNNVFLGPNVNIYTATHPLDAESRNQGLEYAYPVTIGDNVWVGGNVVINPGISIGKNSVIGSGSVVTKDIPDHVLAAGNPCRIIKYLQ